MSLQITIPLGRRNVRLAFWVIPIAIGESIVKALSTACNDRWNGVEYTTPVLTENALEERPVISEDAGCVSKEGAIGTIRIMINVAIGIYAPSVLYDGVPGQGSDEPSEGNKSDQTQTKPARAIAP
jgi:hypothetical protein